MNAQTPPSSPKAIYDFFVSYKQKDSRDFTAGLADELRGRGYAVWLDNDEILPGDSILSSIERGLKSSLVVLLVFSRDYFQGWSESERRSAHSLMMSKKVRIIPVWYDIGYDQVLELAPLFADIKAVVVDSSAPEHVTAAGDEISRAIRPDERRQRLFELFFKCLVKHFPDDPELKMWVALFDNDVQALERALHAGADPNLTDTSLYNRYAREAVSVGCFEEWRRLYLHFHERGELRSQSPADAG